MFGRVQVNDILAGVPYKKVFLGTGEGAIHGTVKRMIEIINKSAYNPYVRKWAEYILGNLPPKQNYNELKLMHNFVRDHTRYTKDPLGMEYLQTPYHLLQLIEMGEVPKADCDDKTMLVLSLMKTIGYPVALKITGYAANKKFKHVYGLVNIKNNTWIPVETVKHNKPFGWEAPNPTRSKIIKV